MSENVIIQEGGKGARMPNVDHILTEDKDTGELIPWVPESERKSGIKYISKNGTFRASDDRLHSWSKVNVGVVGGKAGTSAPSEDSDGRQVPTGEGKEYIVPAGIGHSVAGYDDYQGGDYTVNVVSGIATDPETGMERRGMPVLRYPLKLPPYDGYPYYTIFEIEMERVSTIYEVSVSSNIWESYVSLYYDEGTTQLVEVPIKYKMYYELIGKEPFKYAIWEYENESQSLQLPLSTIHRLNDKGRIMFDFIVEMQSDIPSTLYWYGKRTERYGMFSPVMENWPRTNAMMNARYRLCMTNAGDTRPMYADHIIVPPYVEEQEMSCGSRSIQMPDGEYYSSDEFWITSYHNPLSEEAEFTDLSGSAVSMNLYYDVGRSVFSTGPSSYNCRQTQRTNVIYSTISNDGRLLDKPIENTEKMKEYRLRMLT